MAEKTEKEKMLAGELYISMDPELVAERKRARRLTRIYNSTTEEEPQKRLKILAQLFGKVRPKAEIEPSFNCDYGSNIFAGDNLYMNFGCVILDCAAVHIGENVMFGPYVQIYGAYHPVDVETRNSGSEYAAPIWIGNNVWIGGNVTILPGVSIGNNAIIGAGSVVVKDVPDNVIAAGNPCRIIKQLS